MNELKYDCFIKFIVQILVNIQIFPLVGGNSSSTRPAHKREYFVKLYNKAHLLLWLLLG